jgi:hypothetical protein
MPLDVARMWHEIGVPCDHRHMSEYSFWELAIGAFVILGMLFSFFRPVDPTIIAPRRVTNLALGIRIKRVIIFYVFCLLAAAVFGLLRGILGL